MPRTREENEQLYTLLKEKRLRDARKSLLSFITFINPFYQVKEHHRIICDTLDDFIEGKTDYANLLILAHPRSGKSEIVSRFLPAYFLGKFPTYDIICGTYGHHLVDGFGGFVRNLMLSEEYKEVFPEVELSKDSLAKNLFRTTKNGTYRGAGVGGAITGFGANLFVGDDLIKGSEAANSDLIKENTWQWLQTDVETRLMPPFRKIIIGTPWSLDDPIGRIRKEPDFEKEWHVLKFPAFNQEEEPLWPERFPKDRLMKLKRRLNNDFQSLFMLDPVAPEGNFFKREHLKYYKIEDQWIQHVKKRYILTDFATTKDAGDYTAFIVVAVDEMDRIGVVDVYRKQEETNVTIDALLDLIQLHRPLAVFMEKGQILRSISPFLYKRMKERNIIFNRIEVPVVNDKEIRAKSIQARISNGMVYFNKQNDYYTDLETELLAFPKGVNDDQVDCFSLLGMYLDNLIKDEPYKPNEMTPALVALEDGSYNVNFERLLRENNPFSH